MNKLNKQDLRKIIKSALFEQVGAAIPGDAPGEKQVHVFDFDDTLGITDNPNGVMPYMNGQPMLKSEDDAKKWLQQNGLQSDLLAPKNGPAIKNVPERGGYAVYLSSAGLAKIQSKVPKEKQKVTGFSQPDAKGDSLLIDFTPSSFVDQKSTKPIKQTIDKLKQANSMGAKTAVMTARKGEGAGINFSGEKVPNTNSADIDKYLSSKGAKPNSGVLGVSGQNKGEAIKKKFDAMNPEEIHFYDDLSKNTAEVGSALETNKDTETFIYGPGDFAHGAANANKPNKIIPKKIGENNMKITREQLRQIVKEELEQEGFFGSLKAKIAPGMAAKSVASSLGDMFTVNKDGVIDITPGSIKGTDFNNVNDRVLKYTQSMINNSNFGALPPKTKKLILNYNKAAKQGKTDGITAALAFVPRGSEFERMLQSIKSGQDAAASAEASAAYEKEVSARRDRNDYYDRKNAALDAELQRKKDKELFDKEVRMSQYEPPESRAARPEDVGGRTTVYSATPRGNVRDAWEESKKIDPDELKKIISEEYKKLIKEKLKK